jgi:lipooligosaccharide transport system permease protein
MFIAFFVATYDNFSKLSYQGIYAVQILSPVEPREIAYGEILWAASKGLFSALGVSLVASVFGLVASWKILLVLFVVFLSSLVFAAFGMLVTTFVKNFDQIIYPSSGLIIPLSLFSGTYFPVDHLPYGLKYLVYLSPLTHSVRAARTLLIGSFDWWVLVNILYLILCAAALTRLSSRRLQERLLD